PARLAPLPGPCRTSAGAARTRSIRSLRCSTSAATRSCAATISTPSTSRSADRPRAWPRSRRARSSSASSAAASPSPTSSCVSRCSVRKTSASSTRPPRRPSSRSSSTPARPGARANRWTGASAGTRTNACRSSALASRRAPSCSACCRSSSSMRIRSNARTRTRFSACASASAGKSGFVRVLLASLLAALLAPGPRAAAQDASARIYVRRIELEGLVRSADYVLRRELLQLEGAFLNTAALDESLRRIGALRFIERVDASVRPVPGTPDLVDNVINVTEAPSRRYGGGGGWSESLRASARLYYADENLLGTGQRLSLAATGSGLRSAFELSHTTPHIRASEIARTIEISSRHVDRLTKDTAVVDARLTSLVLEYGYPLAGAGRRASPLRALAPVLADEETLLPTAEIRERLAALGDVLDELRPTACCGTLRLGVALRRSELTPAAGVSTQLADWLAGHGAVEYADLRE